MSTAPTPNFGLASFGASSVYNYDVLLSDGHHVVSRKGTLASGLGFVKRGTIVDLDVATGAVILGTLAGCNAVVAENADATSATVEVLLYTSGKMKADAITWPLVGSHAAVTDRLRDYGILIESVLFRDGLIVKTAPTAAEEEAARARIETNRERLEDKDADAPEEEPAKTVADSSWGYLTPEERENQPTLGDPPLEAGPEPEPLVEEDRQPNP